VALPYSRSSNPTGAAPVLSADVAELMDACIADAQNTYQLTFKAIAYAATNWAQEIAGGTCNLLSSGAGLAFLQCPALKPGTRILGFKARAKGDGAVDVTYNLLAGIDDGTGTTLATLVDNNRSGAAWSDAVLAMTGGVPYTVAVGDSIVLTALASAANARILKCTLTLDRPIS
jgi:hypothetical protein